MICHFRKGVAMEIDEQYLKNQISDFRDSFCPYGYLDVKRAIEVALEVGEDADWAFDEIERFADECEVKLKDIDPCYVVMDSVLQQARNEIDDLTGFDVQNDADYYTAGNYMATTYDWRGGDMEALIDKLREYHDFLENLSDATVYWLSQVDLIVEDLEPLVTDDDNED